MALTKVSRGLLSTSIVDNGNATAITIDSSENVGVGVTPESWNTYKTLQIGNGAIANYTPTHDMRMVSNAYYNSGWKYAESDGACLYLQDGDNSAHIWSVAASGTADAALTWSEAMRISGSNVGIGTSSPNRNLHVSGGAADVAFGITNSASGTSASDGFSITLENPTPDVSIRQRENAAMKFLTNNTERLRIESSGNVAIGTSGVSAKLHIAGSPQATNGALVFLRNDDATTSNTTFGGVHFSSSPGTDFSIGKANVNTATSLSFRNGNSGASLMDLDASGNLLVGRTSAGATGNGHTIRGGDSAIFSRDSSGESMIVARNASAGDLVRFYCNGSDKGSIDFDGSNTISYTSSSDQRLKENIVDAPSASNDIDAIQVRSFDWKADGSHQKYGMVAQELLEVAPEAVSQGTTEEDMMGVDYSKLVPMMIKEIQSLRREVEALKENN